MPMVVTCHPLKCFCDSTFLFMEKLFTDMPELHVIKDSAKME